MMGSALVALGTIAACRSINFTGPRDTSGKAAPPDLLGAMPDLLVPTGPTATPINLQTRVDVLIVVDDSPSMKPKQIALGSAFSEVVKAVNQGRDSGRPGQYHIGVITSDLGAATTVISNCKAGGKGAKLQPIGEGADTDCLPPTGSSKFIDVDQIAGTSNLPSAPATASDPLSWTFGCMSSVGDFGCGFEQTLESTHKALTDTTISENAGFLREEATLIVVFVTDEDDCSVPPNSDLFDPMKSDPPPAGYGVLQSYRCANFGVVCTNPATNLPERLPYAPTGTAWTNCRGATAAEGGLLYETARYKDLFNKPRSEGGIKHPGVRVALFGITGPSAGGITVVEGNPPAPTGADGQPAICTVAKPPYSQQCSVLEKHSCVIEPNNHADPGARMREVIESAQTNALSSICDSFTSTLAAIGTLMTEEIGTGCLTRAIANPTEPSCTVEDVVYAGAATPTRTALPKCDATSSNSPCWKLETNAACAAVTSPVTNATEQLRLSVVRTGAQPLNTGVTASCITVAPKS